MIYPKGLHQEIAIIAHHDEMLSEFLADVAVKAGYFATRITTAVGFQFHARFNRIALVVIAVDFRELTWRRVGALCPCATRLAVASGLEAPHTVSMDAPRNRTIYLPAQVDLLLSKLRKSSGIEP